MKLCVEFFFTLCAGLVQSFDGVNYVYTLRVERSPMRMCIAMVLPQAADHIPFSLRIRLFNFVDQLMKIAVEAFRAPKEVVKKNWKYQITEFQWMIKI